MKPEKGYSEAQNTVLTGLKDETLLSHPEALPQSRCIVYIFQEMSEEITSSQKYKIIFSQVDSSWLHFKPLMIP